MRRAFPRMQHTQMNRVALTLWMPGESWTSSDPTWRGPALELLEHLEYVFLYDSAAPAVCSGRKGQIGCRPVAKNLIGAIEAFRDKVNATKDSFDTDVVGFSLFSRPLVGRKL